MVWRETGIMDERRSVCLRIGLQDERDGERALCEPYGISRKTGYKWLGRYRDLGAEGFA